MPPPIVKRLTAQLRAKGMPEGKANAVAIKKMQEAGNLKPGSTDMTEKGKARTAMGAAGRAKDRAAKETGRKPGDYTYNQLNNTARLKRK
jgi:hypothetical protein